MDGHSEGLVESTLGPDKKPVYKGGDQLSNKSNFDQWFRDVPGVNRRVNFKMDLNKSETGTYVHDNPSFFPVDGKGWGELGQLLAQVVTVCCDGFVGCAENLLHRTAAWNP